MTNSKLIFSAAVAISTMLGIGAASAADLPLKSPSYLPPTPVFTWSGFYVGVHGGYGWGSNNWNFRGFFEDPTFTLGNLTPKTNSVLGGVQAGANYQIASWVLGVEADWAFMHGQGSTDGIVSPVANTATGTSQIEWLATFAGRAGYAWDRSLLYIKGGVAAAGVKDDFALSNTLPAFVDFGTKSNTMVGWTLGAGFEYVFAPHWSAKIEYNYVGLGTATEKFNIFSGAGGTLTATEDIHRTLQIVKVGASYRFGEQP